MSAVDQANLARLLKEATGLVHSGYPIDHDEGCYLHFEWGKSNFEGYLDDRELVDGIDNFDVDKYTPFCICDADNLNNQARLFVSRTNALLTELKGDRP